MTGPDHPESIRPVVVDAPAVAFPQPTLTLPSKPSPKRRARTAEILRTGLVLTFAFLAASFVARNADFWLHLATGRLLAHGGYSFGSDPFAYTTAGVSWVNHAWLFDRIAYLLYREEADIWLVVLKAAMIAVLAGFLLRMRQPEKPGWVPAFCTALAVLAMSPHVLLQPRCVSVALLGLTLWLLWRGRAPARLRALTQPGSPMDARILLIPLCALWVNLDDWFLLGPLLVGLFWIGDRMQPLATRPRGMRPTPAWLFPACLAACLCSPYHVFGFTLPADLYPLPFSGGLLQDVRFRPLVASPWQFDAALRSPAGANIAGLAYFVLVVLGVASFVVNRAGLRDWRILTWAIFALLGALSVRFIPFFAVIGGPVAVLNVQGMKFELRPRILAGLRAACLLFLVALIALAVPGWLHGFNQKAVQVAWGVEINPSLRRAAETLHRWRQAGMLDEGQRSFCVHPDAAAYCAWFCPDEKSFLDPRLSLFSGAMDDYTAVCRGLDPSLSSGAGTRVAPGGTDWRKVLRERGVAVVVLYDPDPTHVLPVFGRMFDNSEEWTLLSIDGQAAIAGWNPARADGFAKLRFDPTRLAFGAADEEAPPAPGQGPGRDPREPDWTTRLGRQPVPAWESAAAGVEMRLFEDPNAPVRREAVDRYYLTAGGGFAGLMGLPVTLGTPGGPLGELTPLVLRIAALQENQTEFRDKPPELALLAVRAARRAVAADPDDAGAYLQLAAAYLALGNETAEQSRGAGLRLLAMLRYVQIVTALRQALILNPDQEAAHQLLADLFLEMQPIPYSDLALKHRTAQLQLTRRFGRAPGENVEAFQRRVDSLEAQMRDLEKGVQDATNRCEIRFASIGDDPVNRAKAARELGLAGKALDDVLLKARVEVYGSAVAKEELELLLLTGRSREAEDMLDDEQMRANKYKLLAYDVTFGGGNSRGVRTFPTYEWLLACAAAADGDYDSAGGALKQIGAMVAAAEPAGRGSYAASVASDLGGLAAPMNALAISWTKNRELHTAALYLQADRDLQAERADLLTVEGLLDLERGAPDEARKRLTESIALSRSVMQSGGDVPGAALAWEYLKRLDAGR